MLKFSQIKQGRPNFWGEPILQSVWSIRSPFLYLNFESFLDPNSSSLIGFQCIHHDSLVLFEESWNWYKLRRVGRNFWGGTNFAECLNYLVPTSVFEFKKFSRPNFFVIHCISMYSVWFRSTFQRVLKFVQIKEGGANFWGEPILQNVWIIWSPLLYFNFKSFLDPISSSFITFQCILHDWGVLFEESWNLHKLKRRGRNFWGGTNFAECLNYLVPPSVLQL